MNWSERVAPGVAIMRFRVQHKLALITHEDELAASANLIEDMARRLDAYRARTGWAAYICALVVVVALFAK